MSVQPKYSKITLTFSDEMPLGGNLSFSYGFGTVGEEWVERRFGPNQVTVGTPTEIPGESSAINFMQSVQLDYEGLFSFSRQGNEVEINGNYPEIQFTGFIAEPPTVVGVVDNFDPQTLFQITGTSFLAHLTNPCNMIRVSVDTSVLATKITSPVQIDNNTDNPFVFETPRAIGVVIECESADGQIISSGLILPGILSPDNIDLDITAHPDGSTVIVEASGYGLELEYSLDDITWHPSSIYIFSGLPAGDYTLYVRDQFGCKVSKPFHVDEFGINDPYFYISKSNSIQYAVQTVWGNCSDYKNDENTLSCQADVPLPYTEIQQFQGCDKITTQVRSNFQSLVANVHAENSTHGQTVSKKTNNIGLKDRRDAFSYSLDNGNKTGIYFTAGDLYDYALGTDIGDYTLNGLLPEWGVIGNKVKIIPFGETSGAWFEIEDIIYNETFGAEVLVVNAPYESNSIQVLSIYNLKPYEVYEFTVDMLQFLNQTIQVEIRNTGSSFGDIILLSELIDVKDRQLNTLEIRYKNRANTDIFYATGIENKLRIPIERIDGKPQSESETHKTDTSALLLSAEIHEANVFEFQPITKQMMWKLVQALSHSDVLLDEVGYVLGGEPETEGALEDTNLYVVKATMIRRTGAFSESGEELNLSGTNTEIPGLVEFGNGFVELG